jgi:hypothetical protein
MCLDDSVHLNISSIQLDDSIDVITWLDNNIDVIILLDDNILDDKIIFLIMLIMSSFNDNIGVIIWLDNNINVVIWQDDNIDV